MEVILAKYAGFCEGVERAYRIALEAASKESPIYILGDLVHNADVVAKFKEKGIITIKSLSEIAEDKKGTLMISAHGVSPGILEEAKKRNLEIIDTTCPWVKKAQRIAKELYSEGYQIIIIGDKGHAEVEGLVGWAGGKASIVSDLSELEKMQLTERIGVIAQTTQSKENFNSIVGSLIKKGIKDLKAHNTICEATVKRQKAATKLAKTVGLMIVVGDFKSANTERLTDLCSKTGVETHQIQTVSELNNSWLKGKNKVGVTAGASTPDWITVETVEKLKSL